MDKTVHHLSPDVACKAKVAFGTIPVGAERLTLQYQDGTEETIRAGDVVRSQTREEFNQEVPVGKVTIADDSPGSKQFDMVMTPIPRIKEV